MERSFVPAGYACSGFGGADSGSRRSPPEIMKRGYALSPLPYPLPWERAKTKLIRQPTFARHPSGIRVRGQVRHCSAAQKFWVGEELPAHNSGRSTRHLRLTSAAGASGMPVTDAARHS